MGVADVRRLKVLQEENRKLEQLVADLSLDKLMLQDVLRKSRKACAAAGPCLVSSGSVWGEQVPKLPDIHPPMLHLTGLEPVIEAKVAHPLVDPSDPTSLYPNRQPTSTSIFRCYVSHP